MKKKSVFSVLFVVSGLLVAGWISYYSLKENKRNKHIQNEIDAMIQEAEKLRKNNEDMKEKITYFEMPEFQEKIAKEKLNLQKEGEKVAIIKPSPVLGKETVAVETTGNGTAMTSKPNYQKWWDYFFE